MSGLLYQESLMLKSLQLFGCMLLTTYVLVIPSGLGMLLATQLRGNRLWSPFVGRVARRVMQVQFVFAGVMVLHGLVFLGCVIWEFGSLSIMPEGDLMRLLVGMLVYPLLSSAGAMVWWRVARRSEVREDELIHVVPR